MKNLWILLFLVSSSLMSAEVVRMETSLGNIEIELNAEKAPVTVKNFLSYVEAGFYKKTIFHRVIKNFMIQGGGFSKDMIQKKTNAPIKNEADNSLLNEVGTIAMARTNDPNSATSQFFINTKDNEFLNFKNKSAAGYGYAVFGKVVKGMDIVRKIEQKATGVKAGYSDVPIEPIEILDIKKI